MYMSPLTAVYMLLYTASRKASPQGHGPEVIENSLPEPSARVELPMGT
jgi:hypothetical protein